MKKGITDLPQDKSKKGIRVRGESLPQYVHETSIAINNLSRDLGEIAATNDKNYKARNSSPGLFVKKTRIS